MYLQESFSCAIHCPLNFRSETDKQVILQPNHTNIQMESHVTEMGKRTRFQEEIFFFISIIHSVK